MINVFKYFKGVSFLSLLIYLGNYLRKGGGFLIGKKYALMYVRLPLSSVIHVTFYHTLSFSHASPIANAMQTVNVHNV